MDKKLLLLFTAVIVLGAGIYFQSDYDKKEVKKETEKDFIEYDVLADTKKIDIISDGHKIFLEHNDKEWIVANKADFNADFVKIEDFINSIQSIKTIHNYKSERDLLEKFGLTDPEETSGQKAGTLVFLKDKEDKKLFKLIIGKKREKGGQYILKPGKDTIYLTKSEFKLNNKPGYWLKNNIADIRKNKITKTALYDSENKKIYEFAQDSSEIKAVYPKNHNKDLDKNKVSALFSGLKKLEASDVIKKRDKDNYNFRLEYTTDENSVINIYIHDPKKNLISVELKNSEQKSSDFNEKSLGYILKIKDSSFQKFILDLNDFYKQD
ncbi:MAG: DUF4340 domain-containing protein [Thermodesulfobacteriota bacterium]